MRRLQPTLRAALAVALLAALPARSAPPQVMTYSGYLKTSSGTAVTTATNLTFRLYTASTGGSAVWTETVSVTPSPDGWFSAVIGTVSALPFSLLNQDLYLSLQVGSDAEFTARARVTPSHSALTVDWSGVQGKPSCTAGAYLTLDAGGGLTCTIPPVGSGGISSVAGTAGGFVSASTSAGAVTLSLSGCTSAGQILQWNGATWSCIATPSGGGGGVTSVSPNLGAGLDISPTTGAVVASLRRDCAANQVLKWSGASGWVCAADDNSGGTLTGVTGTAPIAASTGASPTIRILPCANGEVLKYSAGAAAWQCAADSNGGGTVTSVSSAGAPVVVTGTATDPRIAITQADGVSSAGYITPIEYNDWYGKQERVTGTCSAGTFITGIAATGGVFCGSGGSVTSVAAGTGLQTTPAGGITSSGTIAIDTAVVPQLNSATNSFAGAVVAGSFSGSGSGLTSLNAGNLASGTVPSARVAGAYGGITGVGTLTGLTLSGDVAGGNNIARNLVPAIAQQHVTFSVNTADSITGTPTVTRGDGTLTISTTAASAQSVDLRPNNGNLVMGAPITGSYLTFRGNFLLSETSQAAYVMHGAVIGVGSQTGGYGFRIVGNGTGRNVSGLVMNSGSNIASQTAAVALASGMHSFLAINRGANVEFFVDGVSLGTASTTNMNTVVFTTYNVRVEQAATAPAGTVGIAYMSLGVPVP